MTTNDFELPNWLESNSDVTPDQLWADMLTSTSIGLNIRFDKIVTEVFKSDARMSQYEVRSYAVTYRKDTGSVKFNIAFEHAAVAMLFNLYLTMVSLERGFVTTSVEQYFSGSFLPYGVRGTIFTPEITMGGDIADFIMKFVCLLHRTS